MFSYVKTKRLIALALIISVTSLSHTTKADHNASHDKITINGSSTVHNFLFYDNIRALHKETGFKFDAFPSSSGRGILALVKGQADIAMISSEFPLIVEKLNETSNMAINLDDYEVHSINKTRILFIAHPDNPINTLSKQQVKDLFTGKIKHWGALGVPNIGPVKIVTEHPTGGIYNTVLQKVTDKTPIVSDKITMQNAPQTAIVVSQVPESFGMLSAATPQEQRLKVKIIETPDFEVTQNMYFVIKKGANEGKISKIIKTIQKKYAP